MNKKEYLVEMRRVGNLVRVSALDPVSGREAVVQGPVSAGETLLTRIAVQKLEYLLKRDSKC